MTEREATCSCGQLRVIATGDPVRVSICHCLACQRRTGSSYGYQARFLPEQVRISGDSREYVRAADEDGAVRRSSFCPECGSTVYWSGEDQPDWIAVAVGAFGEPGFPAPTRSVWEERKHGWVVVPAEAEHIY
ncbi:MAG TPA: GFA family protein [Solirubrobacteraceae bacterium]|nr:GFA family protein [Solirubrobacteraceae bacterium]